MYSTGNSAQCHVVAWRAGEFGGEWMHGYVRLSHSVIHLKLSQHYQSAILQYKIEGLNKKQNRTKPRRHHYTGLINTQRKKRKIEALCHLISAFKSSRLAGERLLLIPTLLALLGSFG